MSPKKNFKVAIVGGSIAGLTLATMLEKFGIDYVLLEAYSEIAPQVGASIGLMPNGLRVLDQLGCYVPLQKLIDFTSEVSYVRNSKGSVIASTKSMWVHLEQRFGYPITFLDRQTLLQVLYENLEQKDNVHTGKRVTHIHMTDSGVEVGTQDGELFPADIVVGADGVHSTVRAEMRRLAKELEPEYFLGDEESKVPARYKCIFGISTPVKGYPSAIENFVFNNGFSHFLVPGPQGRVYWFLFVDTGETVYGDKIPHYTKEDEAELAAQHFEDPITDVIKFRDIYESKISAILVPLQEHVFRRWHFRRIITIGDSVHKQNPIGGQGGNQAIESATVLVNTLLRKMDARPAGLSGADIDEIFAETQKTRRDRAELMMSRGKQAQEVHAQASLPAKIIPLVMPLLGRESVLSMLSGNFTAGAKLERLPVPRRTRAYPFNDELPAKELNTWIPQAAAVASLCVIGISAWGLRGLPEFIHNSWPSLATALTLNPSNFVKLQLPIIDNFANTIAATVVWTVEGFRAGNQASLLSLPVAFAIGSQMAGFNAVAPLYYLASVLSSFSAPVGRAVPVRAAEATLTAVTLGAAVPALLRTLSLSNPTFQRVLYVLSQTGPVVIPALTLGLSFLSSIYGRTLRKLNPKDAKLEEEVEMYKKKDVGILKLTYGLSLAALAGLPAVIKRSQTLQPEQGSATHGLASVSIYNMYTVVHLRQLSYITTGEAIMATAAVVAGQVSVGPGVTALGLWYWREVILARLAT